MFATLLEGSPEGLRYFSPEGLRNKV